MALIDRAIIGASVAFLNSKEYVSGATVAPNSIQVDPIVSGTDYSHLFENGQSNSYSLPISNLSKLNSFTIELYTFYSFASSGDVAKFGASSFITADPLGFLTFTLPYSTPKVVRVDYDPDQATQISVSMSTVSYRIMINGATRAEGPISNLAFQAKTTIDFASVTGASIVIGAVLFYEAVSQYQSVQSNLLEAFVSGPDAELWMDGTISEITDTSQTYVAAMSVPGTTSWDSFSGSNVLLSSTDFGLKISSTEQYDSSNNSFILPNVGDYCLQNSGTIKHRIPSFTTGAARGILYLKSLRNGIDEFAIVVNSSNQVQAYRKQFAVDVNGNEISAFATYGSASTALTNGAELHYGFGWQDGQFYLLNNTSSSNQLDLPDFNPKDYTAIFGGPLVDGVINVASYFASRGAWTSELRAFNSYDVVTSATEYGNHTFFSASTEDMPVRAEGSVTFEMPLFGKVRKPYMLIDGKPNGTVTEQVLV